MRTREWEFISEDRSVKHKVKDILLYSDEREKIVLEFKPVRFPEDGNIMWEDWNNYDSIQVFKTDYERLLLNPIRSIFPVNDPDPNGWGMQECFDLTSMNFFGKDDWIKLIDVIKITSESVDDCEKEFYDIVVEYLTDIMEVSDYFCIEGNL